MRQAVLSAMLALLCVVTASGQYKSKVDQWACTDREFMENFKDALYADDKEAVQIALVSMSIARDCVEIKKDEKVDLVDVEWFSGIIVIRKKGHLGRYYGISRLFKDERSD